MKENKKKFLVVLAISIIVLIIIGLSFIVKPKPKEEHNTNQEIQMLEIPEIQIDKNQVDYKETANIQELKQNAGLIGDVELYEVITEYDGRKGLAIKNSVQYQVAVSGMLQEEFTIQEVEEIIKTKAPPKAGIWIEKSSREKITQLLPEIVNLRYTINNEGYLQREKSSTGQENELDIILNQYIQGDKQILLANTGKMKIVDEVTGNVQEYPFEKMDPYQAYDYIENDGNYIICLTSNTQSKLTNSEIGNAILSILKK